MFGVGLSIEEAFGRRDDIGLRRSLGQDGEASGVIGEFGRRGVYGLGVVVGRDPA